MKLIKILSLISVVLMLSSCGNQNPKKNSLTISGTITGAKDKTRIFLTYDNNIPINVTEIMDGEFEMSFTLDEVPSQVVLYLFVDKVRKEKMFYIDNRSITVSGDINQMYKLKITGSKYNDDLEAFYEYSEKKMGNTDSLYQLIPDSKDKMDSKQKSDVYAKIDKIEVLNLDIKKSYIRNHPNNYASLLELCYSCNEIKKDSLKVLYNNLSPELKSKRHAKYINDYIKSNSPEVGDHYTDFEAMDKTGKTHRISEIKGKYILLDFTRVSCGACCAANSGLAILHQKYSKQLAVVSFSSDSEKKDWLDGIKEFEVDWLSLWDGKETKSPIYKKYVDGGMPQFYLINPKGIVVKKWEGYGPKSFERIQKYLF